MIPPRIAKLSLTLLFATPISALADAAPPETRRDSPPIIGFFDTAKPHCYARTYDPAHMVAHPKQKVTALAFAYTPTMTSEGQEYPMWDQWSDEPAFTAQLVVTFKGEKRTAFGSAYCHGASDPKTLNCGIEGDGGSFTLTAKPDGKFRLDNPDGFAVSFPPKSEDEPDDGVAPVNPRDDQDAFLLSNAKGGLCDKEWTAD